MKYFKRIGLFILTNILIITVISILLRVFNVQPYMTQYGVNYTQLMIFCLIWGMGGAFISLLLSKFMAKMMMGVKTVDPRGPYAGLVQRVHHYARQAGMTHMPEVGVYESPDVNAFATGPSERFSLVAVSTGLLNRMDSDEVDGVLAHEVSHIANGDMVTMTLIQGVMNAFVMFAARVIAFAIDNAMRDDRGRGGLGPFAHIMVVIVLQIVFGILAQFVVAYFSRWREYRADAGAAKIAGRDKMIRALQRLQTVYPTAPVDNQDAMASMKISSRGGMMALLSTHPPLEDRIKALSRA